MRTAASEHLSHAQVMSRLGSTFGALIHEQIEIVSRHLDDEESGESGELRSIAELSVRLVERSAEWLQVGNMASLALEIREAMAQLGQLRPTQRQELLAQCRVALDTQKRLADRLRADGFASLVEHAEQVTEAIDRLRSNLSQARSQARGMIDAPGPEIEDQENLLALTFEIKNALIHQNERLGQMNEMIDGALRSSQAALSDWETVLKSVERQRMAGVAEPLPDGKPLAIHQRMQDVDSGLHSLAHEVAQLLALQYSLERRARDLDEHLLWEFLDPLDRYVDELYAAIATGPGGSGGLRLAVQTGGVGFEPEIGSILLPLLMRALGSATPRAGAGPDPQVRFTAAREGLEARIEIEGPVDFDEESVRLVENALESLGGFAALRGAENGHVTLQVQFPMARSIRSFLIVEAAGQRLALPWSAIERIYASREEVPWGDGAAPGQVHPLAGLFGRDVRSAEGVVAPAGTVRGGEGERGSDGALAVLRCGSGSAVVSFDRIVWRENARLRSLPSRLDPFEDVLGGIVAPDSTITLVLNPAALLRRAVEASALARSDAS